MAIQFVPTKCPACSGQLDIDLENKTAVCKYCQSSFLITDSNNEVTRVEIVNAEKAGIEFENGRKIARQGGQGRIEIDTVPKVAITDNDSGASSGCLLVFFGLIMVWLAFATFCGFVG